MRVLITGGAGFLSSHVGDAFLRGYPRFRHVRESVLNGGIIEGLVAWNDVVYHLAAVVGVEHYVGDPCQVLAVSINEKC